MRAYHIEEFGSFDGLQIREDPVPEPASRDVLVRLHASALNYRDLHVCEGRSQFRPRRGLVPLCDGAGEVVAVGKSVTRFSPGDRVAATCFPRWVAGRLRAEHRGTQLGGGSDGTLREYALFDEDGLVTLPDHLSFEEGATLPCAAVTAWTSLTTGRPLLPGQTVLTQGSGGVSVFAVQLGKLFGARVIATTSSPAKAERLRALGADATVDYRAEPAWDLRVRELTGGRGADVVVEVGGAATLTRSLRATAVGGKIALVGYLGGATGPERGALAGSGISVHTITVGNREDFEALNEAVALHRLRPAIDRVFAFDEAKAAYRHLAAGNHIGKVVIAHGTGR